MNLSIRSGCANGIKGDEGRNNGLKVNRKDGIALALIDNKSETGERRYTMGDKGKKDKDKSQKQKQNKHDQKAKKKQEKQPSEIPFQRGKK
jgi:hypothetical protein